MDMLYKILDSLEEAHGEDYFKSRIDSEIIQNLNPNFVLREYQKEALGRFDFYFNEYCHRKYPTHLLFHMATGSGKTLIMAANILQLYKKGYRNFIFFVNSINIIEKTKDNFLNSSSAKYLFAPKIKINNKKVSIKEVSGFDGVNSEDINILFTTIQALHIRMVNPKENVITEEDFEDKEIVLISDEAHHLQTLTKKGKEEEELEKSWEYTIIEKIFKKNPKNILLEFTATIDLSNENINQKYQDKIIYQYDLRQFRLDKYSKEIEVLEADLDPIDRAIQSIILSQYKRKVAEKYRLYLKPVILFKSKSIKESESNYKSFLDKINNLKRDDLKNIKSKSSGTDLGKAFEYFEKENISLDNLIKEIQNDFSKDKVILLDSENIDEKKQLLLNSLENKNNEIRAIFAVNMLNEGWDVLNLFDIVRLYDTRDGKWVKNKYKPGNTTIGEAQLIGRGARYWPFSLNTEQDKYTRKYDSDLENELRIIETLHYHCFKEPRYIQEIKTTLTEMGLISEKYVQRELFIKDEFKKTDFWNKGYVFINERIKNPRNNILGLKDIKIQEKYNYEFRTGEVKEEFIFENRDVGSVVIKKAKREFNLIEFGENVIRNALDRIEFYYFSNLIKYFPKLKSIKEFITSEKYLAKIVVEVSASKEKISNLKQDDKLKIILDILVNLREQIINNTTDYIGSRNLKNRFIKEVFVNKKLKIDKDDNADGVREINLAEKDWYAQNNLYGTSEEEDFIYFMDNFINTLKEKYSEVALLRNEKHFQIYDFDTGQPFEPDFLLLLKNKNQKIITYQIFIEAKGDQFKDKYGKFEYSKEGWKEKFLLRFKSEAKPVLEFENEKFIILGLPFYNKLLENEFEKTIKEELLGNDYTSRI
ncbi:MAG: DEAD/DEAH box helicase family protein [Elusimicrobiales bacterium]|nr:DEAD/DEAH box helicase family protein [Elusimicrobiales bacterium]